MRTHAILSLSFLIIAASICQAAEIIDRESLFPCIVYLRQPIVSEIVVDGSKAEMWYKLPNTPPQPKIDSIVGTGFLLKDSNSFFLVTASHVATRMTPSSQVFLKGTNEMPVVMTLSQLCGNSNLLSWVVHPEADVAVLHFPVTQKMVNSFLQKHFVDSTFLLATTNSPARDKPLTVFGFPLGLGVEPLFAPLTRQTYAASGLLKLPRFDNGTKTTFFILEDPSIGGYSGGPVVDISLYKWGGMKLAESDTRVVGIIHGTISDPTGGKLAAVTPSYFIIEILNMFNQRKIQ